MNWKAKLTSRKFWIAVAAFVALLVTYFGGAQDQADKTAALIMAGATVIAYIIGEGLTDAAAAQWEDVPEDEIKPPEAVETGGD